MLTQETRNQIDPRERSEMEEAQPITEVAAGNDLTNDETDLDETEDLEEESLSDDDE